ncbi:hypothetical protein ACFQ3P_26015 [Paraburkholderia sabiae]|uniref:Uncharacterized protein n=1 Tax=Paraburkholderia sabiae TaxID=273251 RepID=A0ABU9QL43_9BURK|nr:hypothetical protein [Paraburkholderia sabiae]WJZ77365.1 hypothetical protein QEN71_35445 [Paraburkholderia sabiae]CAD6547610.1 hypothetical protein LMG24235_04451 [Paraburkholderia sabiae]CAG9232376.1 exported hypothetical protein [Paraburkholderia sabiae]
MRKFAKKLVPAVMLFAAASVFSKEGIYFQSNGKGDSSVIQQALQSAGYELLPPESRKGDAFVVTVIYMTDVQKSNRIVLTGSTSHVSYNCDVGGGKILPLAIDVGTDIRANTNLTAKGLVDLQQDAAKPRIAGIIDALRSDDAKDTKNTCASLKSRLKL